MMLSYQLYSDKLTNMHNTILFMAGEFPGPVSHNPSLYINRKAWEPFPAFMQSSENVFLCYPIDNNLLSRKGQTKVHNFIHNKRFFKNISLPIHPYLTRVNNRHPNMKLFSTQEENIPQRFCTFATYCTIVIIINQTK